MNGQYLFDAEFRIGTSERSVKRYNTAAFIAQQARRRFDGLSVYGDGSGIRVIFHSRYKVFERFEPVCAVPVNAGNFSRIYLKTDIVQCTSLRGSAA